MTTRIEKPWGYEELIEKNSRYVMKKLFMKKGCRCSLQKHLFKHETFFVVSGRLMLTVDNCEITMEPGSYYVLPPGKIHRMTGIEDSVYIEASTPELDDVVRIEDDYKRL